MRDFSPSVVQTRDMNSAIGVEDVWFGERSDDSAPVTAWTDSMECLTFGGYFDQEINGEQ